MEKEIDNIFYTFYTQSLGINIVFLKMFDETEVKMIKKFPKLKHNNDHVILSNYKKKIDYVLKRTIHNLIDVEELTNKIKMLTNENVFSFIEKKKIVIPNLILEKCNNASILQSILETMLETYILESYFSYIKKCKYFYNLLNIKTKESLHHCFYIAEELQNIILNKYLYIFYDLYVILKNKYQNNLKYIFPMIINNKLKMSGIIEKSSLGGAESVNMKETNEKRTDLKHVLQNLNDQDYITNLYTKDDFERLETVFTNSHINTLIKQKELKLSKNFQELVTYLLNEDNMDEKDKRKYFSDIFILNTPSDSDAVNTDDTNKKTTLDKIYNLYDKDPNKQVFIDYLIDKISHTTHLNEEPPTTNDCDNRSFEENNILILSMIDKIFDKILTNDYKNNSLKLKNDDMKFILMLETLNSIKSNTASVESKPANQIITVNVNRESVKHTKINNEEIEFN